MSDTTKPISPTDLPLLASRAAAAAGASGRGGSDAARRLAGSGHRADTTYAIHPVDQSAPYDTPDYSPDDAGDKSNDFSEEPSGFRPHDGHTDADATTVAGSGRPGRSSRLTLDDHGNVNWSAVDEIRAAVSEQIKNDPLLSDELSRQALNRDEHGATVRRMTSQEVTSYNQRRLSRGEPSMPRAEQLLLERAVDDSLFGLGRLQPLIDLEGLENLLIAGYDNVRLEFGDGRIERGARVAESNAELDRLLKHVAETMSGGTKTFSSSNCVLNMALPDDARLAAAIRISDVPRISIRKHNHTDVDLAQLSRETQVLDQGQLHLLTAATRAGFNIVFSGLPGAGKTTMARSLMHMLPPEVHIGTIETKYELFLHRNRERHHFVTNFQELLSTGESAQDTTYDVGRLLEMILQHSPERVCIGELLGPEILALFKVLQSTKGSVSTLHADTADDAIERLATLLLESGSQFNTQFAYRQIAQNIDLIVHVDSIDQRSQPGGRRHRFISEIRAPELAADGATRGISAEQIYKPGPDGRGIPTGIRPSWIDRLRHQGYDPNRWLIEGGEAWTRSLNVLPTPELAL